MNPELRPDADGVPGVLATSQAAMQAQVADVVVFDVDGVLMDVHGSYPVVISRAVDAFLAEQGFVADPGTVAITPEETRLFKAAGGFNSDWQLAQGGALVYLVKGRLAGTRSVDALRAAEPGLEVITRQVAQRGGGLSGLLQVLEPLLDARDWQAAREEWDRDRVTRLCQEYYAGERCEEIFGVPALTVRERGLLWNERPLVSPRTLERLPFRYGIYTGRNFRETLAALEIAGLVPLFPPEAMITEDAGVRKPNPEGLFRIARALEPRLMVYAGDNLDDWQTAARYESERALDDPPCLFAGVLGGSPGAVAEQLFRDRGVGLLTTGVEALMRWLEARRAAAGRA
ncbi:MAG: haloacid dehalogenase [Firmicutes bacterium]|nr:haloacid dehalogenase [Bacillota bacterium]